MRATAPGRGMDPVRRVAKPVTFVLCLLPALAMVLDAATGHLAVNPIQELINRTGLWAVRLLLVTLAVTPLRRLPRMGWLIRLRRMLGLYAFFYALAHLLVYLVLNQGLVPALILADLGRPYILAGYAAVALLIPLAVTSTDGMMRRLGRRWKRLHRLVYPAAILAVAHYLMLVKLDLRPPLTYAGLLALLLGWRLVRYAARRLRRHRAQQAGQRSPG
ncbi:MAG TPA: protein-methionine-sulfoxide reductase heme-binding subunit MsrQ [Gammaproteobacteria bacterium]|nr:protein-methionine-sulfoxide reductase heme-binding subunit MsrQ [Gammaproteobacteria bacterium]